MTMLKIEDVTPDSIDMRTNVWQIVLLIILKLNKLTNANNALQAVKLVLRIKITAILASDLIFYSKANVQILKSSMLFYF